MTAFMVYVLPVEKRKLSWRLASRVIVSWEQPRSDAVGWRLARRVVDAWEQLRSVALRAARGRHALARALPKGLLLAREADIASDFSCASPQGVQGAVGTRLWTLMCTVRCDWQDHLRVWLREAAN
jgi:hypothetical protein